MVQQGASLDRCMTSKYGFHNTNRCEHCGAENVCIEHVVWTCPPLQREREKTVNSICPQMCVQALPASTRYGIAPALSPLWDHTFWGAKADDIDEKKKTFHGCGKRLTTTRGEHIKTNTLSQDSIDTIQRTYDAMNSDAQDIQLGQFAALQVVSQLRHATPD